MKKDELERIKEPKEDKISKWKDILEIVKSVLIVLGIIGTGLWFYGQGEVRPRADISHEITYRKIHKDNNWVHVLVKIKNIGKTPIYIDKGIVWLQQITPLPDNIKKDINSGLNIVNSDHFIVSWPSACKNQKPHEIINPILIEPGETDRTSYEFIIPISVTTVKVFSYFENPQPSWFCWIKAGPVGWNTETIYDIK